MNFCPAEPDQHEPRTGDIGSLVPRLASVPEHLRITVRLFALLRDRAGVAELALVLPSGATVRLAAERLKAQHPSLADLLPRVAYAVNRAYVAITTELHDGDELAIIPPVSGG